MLRNDYLKRIKQIEEELYRDRSQYVNFLTKLAKLEGVGFKNSLQIWKVKPDATILKSYDEWKELGRQVKYGEKGIAQLLGEKKNRRVGIKFDISQTYGEVKETNEILPKANINEVKDYLLDYLNQNCVSFQETIQLSPKHDFFVESLLVMMAAKQGIAYEPNMKSLRLELSQNEFEKIGKTINFFKLKAFDYIMRRIQEKEITDEKERINAEKEKAEEIIERKLSTKEIEDIKSTQTIINVLESKNEQKEQNAMSGSVMLSPLSDEMFWEIQKEKSRQRVENYKITEEVQPEKLTPSERLNNNIEAISMLKRLESGQRELDINAQDVLSKYVGWGGLAEIFDEEKSGQWEVARNFLKENLTEKEYKLARESTLTAFYTPKTVIEGIYQTLNDMGFRKGNILEPSVGIGNFIGNLPEEMKKSKFYGVELDSISGRIAKQLYPQSKIEIKGLENTNLSNNFFDIAIGNVPFGDFKVSDKTYDNHGFLIHDYFFAKTLDKVRTGGIIAFITSSGTMDKENESVRKYLAARAELIGAIRLPNDTFKGVAGTEVTSDILFLRKRESVFEREEDWIHLATDKRGYTYNKYFVEHPEMVLGSMEEISGRFGKRLACIRDKEKTLKESLEVATKEIAQNTRYKEVDLLEGEIMAIPATDDVKNYTYTIKEDTVYYRENSVFLKKEVTEKEKEKIKAYVKVREALKDVLNKQRANASDEDVEAAQIKLKEVHQKFLEEHKYINASNHRTLLREDSDYPLVSSIEVLDNEGNYVGQGDIFTKRTIQRAKAIERVETGKEALILSISEKGKVDFNYMSSLTGKNREELIQELKGEIFLNITNEISIQEKEWLFASKGANEVLPYVTKEEYLSGNIRDKIKQIDNYLQNYELRKRELSVVEQKEYLNSLDKDIKELEYQKNILTEALPKELTASEIRVKLGATWVPEKDIQNFVYHLLKTPFYLKNSGIKVSYSPKTAEWQIEGKSNDTGNAFAESNFGTSRVNAYKIIENMLNLRKTNIYDRVIGDDGKVRSVLNAKETMLAEGKQELIQMEFDKWIFAEEERRNRLVTLYNERFNSVRNREYDGSNLSLEGINSEITLRPHQKDAIARCLFGGNTLLAHVVGAGKTFSMVASAMESKRLGMCRKSLFVVPKHLTGQIGREFMQLYPGANILVADDDDFKKDKRKRFISKIATGDFDAVILGNTQFEKIPMSEEYQRKHIEGQIQEIVDFLEENKYNFGQKFSVKQMEKTKKKLEARLEKLHNNFNKDDVITFEELGVDRLFVDEAHYYKNLYHHTKMQNVAGIGQTEAAKSSDLFMKCRYMDEITGGKGIVFATGTPVSNSMSELYTMQKYLQYETLKKADFLHFDAWASTFAEVKTDTELAPEGSGYRTKTRFSRFDNLPELMTMFREIADIKMAESLNLSIPEAKYEIIKTQPSNEQQAMLKTFSKRAEKVRNRAVDQADDNMLKITGDGKKLALDQRLINPLLPDVPGSKINTCVDKIYQIWTDTEKQKATQLVFSDLGTPDQKKKEFNIYDDIREKLVNKGVPRKEIAFIHEANTDQKKDELFAKVRKGEVRILIGSTPKMGAGTNVQDKLIALHDLDVPYRPSDLEQRRGRIVRQGNENKEVSVYRYITENTFDSYCWQIIENKQRFISQIMTNKTPIRTMEDIDEVTLSYAEIKALATGNPLIKEKMDLENQVTRLKILQSNHKAQIYQLQDKISNFYPAEIRKLEHKIENVKQDIISRQPVEYVEGEKVFSGIILGKDYFTDRKQAIEELMKEVKKAPVDNMKWIGSYRNFKLGIFYSSFAGKYMFTLKGNGEYTGELKNDDFRNIRRMDNSLDKMEERLERFQEKLKSNQMQLELAKEGVNTPFEQEEILKDKLLRLIEVNAELDRREEKNGMESLLQEAKKEILNFCHREYERATNIEDFDKEFEDLTHVGLAYTETPDEKHQIECVLNLKEYKATLLVDDIPVRIEEYLIEGESEESAIKAMIDDLKYRPFESFVEVNESELQEVLGLKIDEEGNYYEEKRITHDLER